MEFDVTSNPPTKKEIESEQRAIQSSVALWKRLSLITTVAGFAISGVLVLTENLNHADIHLVTAPQKVIFILTICSFLVLNLMTSLIRQNREVLTCFSLSLPVVIGVLLALVNIPDKSLSALVMVAMVMIISAILIGYLCSIFENRIVHGGQYAKDLNYLTEDSIFWPKLLDACKKNDQCHAYFVKVSGEDRHPVEIEAIEMLEYVLAEENKKLFAQQMLRNKDAQEQLLRGAGGLFARSQQNKP